MHGLRGETSDVINLTTGQARPRKTRGARFVSGDLVWFVQLVGTLRRILEHGGLLSQNASNLRDMTDFVERLRGDKERVLDAFFDLFEGAPPPSAQEEALWNVNRNRTGRLAMVRSTATVKADAARQVFGVTGAGVRWAVVDSGIDASHMAFRKRSNGDPERPWRKGTRVIATYDFSSARKSLGEHARRALEASLAEQGGEEERAGLPDLHGLDWVEWGERLEMRHDETSYKAPRDKHGTHVAGILAADWRADDDDDDALAESPLEPAEERVRTGVCPGIELYDIRVTDDNGECDEFSLIAALQFIRALNAKHDHVEIAGVNVSLSLLHDVANYACGRTPVCEECERLVASGVVVVAAAGNQGRARYMTASGEVDEGYRSISITDPGNAPSVITVGATHRLDPHGYGVSYFSSRGPTGDGRLKPDLVAPGEKVVSTVPGGGEEAMDGTSMAAPHVSGAAAMLLARHPELKGRPAEIKRILCSTAVDLGRERYFQGAGLVDILHALESI